MRKLILAAALVAFAGSASAADDMMAGYFGNTVVATGGPATSSTHFRADHSFDVIGSMMGFTKSFKGTWELKGNQLCRTYVGDQPPGLPSNPFCTPWDAHKAGDTWTVTFNGSTRTLTLKPGVQ
ncbi:MAG: hypothetical protein JSR60_06600 [Proteobacteria bacterium]|nr:hypothetical protein [Pseudomonadota bacterium]